MSDSAGDVRLRDRVERCEKAIWEAERALRQGDLDRVSVLLKQADLLIGWVRQHSALVNARSKKE